ncbi:magnesium-transporting ATPase (P-type) [Peribacillus deserti]|uniref:Magnesium-transporting ATPase (P-type) n=1 Tax=Peribacillus deserti TaxID=673318 RepID=A0ABS2QF15_9BACI|nr:hypothetical protein [Peribacillus deserti]MBM7691723.1 magnesium-transporting ATPase (P-type) [Peribacillus deserti]
MKDVILRLAEILNDLHDFIQVRAYHSNFNLTDKDLHFWLMGIIGILAFIFVLLVSKFLSKIPYGIIILSFLYTFTFMVVLVFAIEIQQALTSRGNMEFQDAIVGLWGFIVFFFVFVAISAVLLITKKLFRKYNRS